MQTIKNLASKVLGSSDEYALPKGSLILVTGASGYIGSHVVNEALAAGYKVRGTARSQEKCDKTKQIFNNSPDYSTAVVANFQDEGTFDQAIQGCDAVIHVASDTTFGTDPNQVVKPTVDGILSLLKSAAKTPSVKRFVLTSSSAAVLLPKPGKEVSVTGDDWNDEAVEIAWAPPPYTEERAFPVYAASKTEAERAFWKYIKENNPHFVANAVLPNFNMGQVLPGGQVGATGGGVPSVLKGNIPPVPPQWMVDTIDDARIHLIAAALDPSIKNERIFAFAHPFNWTDVVNALKEIRPQAQAIAKAPENELRDLSKIPNQKGAELLKKWYGQETGWKPFKQSVEENLEGQE